MSRLVIKAKKIVCDEKEFIEDGMLYVDEGKIVSINEDCGWDEYTLIDCSAYKLFPGLIDIHIHGARGKDFVEGTQDVITAVSHDVIQDGVTAYVASLTVVSHERMLTILEELAKVSSPIDGARYLGIHAEGPYISKKFKALMDESHIREPNIRELEEMFDKAQGKLVMMTYSPHDKSSQALLEYAKNHDIKMMIGHTEASCDQTLMALKNGASGYTHFYNAMSGHHHRDEGVVTAGLISNNGYAEIIADTIHVSPKVLNFTYKLMGSSRLILITDAMPGKSMEDGIFYFSDLESVKKEGKAYVKESGRLAGSVIGLNEALYQMNEICGCNDNELVEMACVNPANLLGLKELGSIKLGNKADFAVFDDRFQCILTIIDGKIVYQSKVR